MTPARSEKAPTLASSRHHFITPSLLLSSPPGKKPAGPRDVLCVTGSRLLHALFQQFFTGHVQQEMGHEQRCKNGEQAYPMIARDQEQTPPQAGIAEIVGMPGIAP